MPENLEQQQLAEGYEQLGIDPFDSPIPGESLTSDPGNPRPFEKPPEFTNVEKAMAFIFDHLTNDGSYEDVLQTMREGTPLDMLAQVYLTKGFQEGKWNPDLMLLLIEPTIYLLMWLASLHLINHPLYFLRFKLINFRKERGRHLTFNIFWIHLLDIFFHNSSNFIFFFIPIITVTI